MITSETYKIELSILTPVVINNGDSYGLFELYPYSDGVSGGGTGWVLKIPKILENMPIRKVDELNRLACRATSNHDDESRNKAFEILQKEVVGKVVKEYGRRPCMFLPTALKKVRANPLLDVNQHMTKPLTGKPYIPGSSLKGALRTAILESLRKQSNKKPLGKAKEFEAQLMTGADRFKVQEDPFKFLKISDFEIRGNSKSVIGCINAGGKVPVYSAMTDAGCLHDFNPLVVADGSISIDSRAPKYLRMPEIKQAVKDFYAQNLRWKFAHCDDFHDQEKEKLLQVMGTLEKDNQFFVRLGHYSGIENMTLNVDNPKFYWKPEINREGTNHFVLIENGYPAGFCMMKEQKV
ncbi:MAG: type III-A CRISPR-associated RAMP protein Csm5 [Sphaerochaetaceae bacterium]|nr:type III-A CRISPR-associated RAMP protein Csm5 [Spirochaetales bacterium]MDY5500213.1 type III-A CRISPR-associated RAMP protein Csm5 [Sphaerochaetaceae bacterium]